VAFAAGGRLAQAVAILIKSFAALFLSIALLTFLCVSSAEMVLFHHPEPTSLWFLWQGLLVTFYPVLAFIAFVPAAVFSPTARTSIALVLCALAAAPLIEIVEVLARGSFAAGTGAHEYWLRILHLVLPAFFALVLGAFVRSRLRRGDG
jgi:hypothetical protein